jgi:hypothetical protein
VTSVVDAVLPAGSAGIQGKRLEDTIGQPELCAAREKQEEVKQQKNLTHQDLILFCDRSCQAK